MLQAAFDFRGKSPDIDLASAAGRAGNYIGPFCFKTEGFEDFICDPDLFSWGSADRETLIVSPSPPARSIPRPTELLMVPVKEGPASDIPTWSGYLNCVKKACRPRPLSVHSRP